jgi:membrane-associated protease RseP (regulator of RpoE activity)
MRKLTTVRGLGIGAAILALAATCPTARGDGTPAAGGGAWIGVTVQALSGGWRERENYWARGVMVAEVAAGGPAARAGITAGDVIESIDSRPLSGPADVSTAEGGMTPGRSVQVVVARSGGRMIKIFSIEPDPLPAAPGDVPTPPAPGTDAAAAALGAAGAGAAAATGAGATTSATAPAGAGGPVDRSGEPDIPSTMASGSAAVSAAAVALGSTAALGAAAVYDTSAGAKATQANPSAAELGVRCENLSFDLAEALGATEGQGVLVLTVTAGSRADKAGIRPGDVISWVGGKPVMDLEHLDSAVAAANGTVAVVTRRGGTTRNVMVEFEEDGGTPPSQSDPLVKALLEEVRSLREEVQKLRNEVANLSRASNTHEP